MDHGFHSYLNWPEDTPYPLFSHWWCNFPMDHPSFWLVDSSPGEGHLYWASMETDSRTSPPMSPIESSETQWESHHEKMLMLYKNPWWITTHGSYPSFCVRGGATIQTLEIPFDKIGVEMSSWFDRNIICKWWVMWVFRCHLRLQEGSKYTGITHNILAGLTQSFPKFVPSIEAQIMCASQLALVQIYKK